jgi:hypothetical protein
VQHAPFVVVVIVDGECKPDERKGRYSEHVCLVAGVRGCDRESLIHNTGLSKQGFRNELVDKMTRQNPARLLEPVIWNFIHSLLLNIIIAPVSGKKGYCCIARPGDISNCDQAQQVGQIVMGFSVTNHLIVAVL